jgi:nicotinamide-nucleotide amidase
VSAAEILSLLEARGWSLALAESLTGGLLADAFVGVPGASKVLRGSVVAYATVAKSDLLGVDQELLAKAGAVDPAVALEMAAGAAKVFKAEVALSATGVAGPDTQDGVAVGTVFIGVLTPGGSEVVALSLKGDRAEIRAGAVAGALNALQRALSGDSQEFRA